MRTIALRKMGIFGPAPNDEVVFDTNRYKETIRWTHIVGLVREGTARMITLFVQVGGTEILLKQQTVVAARDSVQVSADIYLTGNYRIGMRAASVQGGEIMELSAFGVVEDPVTVDQNV